jgi:molecular chaperone HtpG
MKSDNLEFLEEKRITDLIKKHSEFIAFPIKLLVEKTTEKEITDDEEVEEKKEGEEVEKKDDDVEIKEEKEESKEKKKKKIKEVTTEYEEQNKSKPIWMRKPETVEKEEYVKFFKSISNDWDEHLHVKQFSVEGQLEFKSILFIP